MLKRNRFISLAGFWLAILLAVTVWAEIPRSITFQGKLTGDIVPTKASMMFTIYDAATGGNQIGAPIALAEVPLKNGIFSVELPLTDAALTFDKTYYVEITVGAEHYPTRQKLTSVPYAIRAGVADSLSGAAASGALGTDAVQTVNIKDLAVTTPKIADGAVTSAKLDLASIDSRYALKRADATQPAYELGILNTIQYEDGLNFDRRASTTMTLSWNGNVGIRNLNPQETLDVAGNTIIRNDLIVVGNITENGVQLSQKYALKETTAVAATALGTDAVQTANIKDLAITTPKLENLSVTSAKIADGAITSTKLDLTSIDARYALKSEIPASISLENYIKKSGDIMTGKLNLDGGSWVGCGSTIPDQGIRAQGNTLGVSGTSMITTVTYRTYGGYFTAYGDKGVGVYGLASPTSSSPQETYGGMFQSSGRPGHGVMGISGQYAESKGVYGYGNGAETYGGYFESPNIAVKGKIIGNNLEYGTAGYFETPAKYGRGVNGVATSTDPNGETYGGRFEGKAGYGGGLLAYATGANGKAIYANGAGENSYGVYAFSLGSNGIGVYGGTSQLTPTAGQNAIGVKAANKGGGIALLVDDVMKLNPRSSAPSNPSAGMIYFNGTDKKAYCYDGTAWKALW